MALKKYSLILLNKKEMDKEEYLVKMQNVLKKYFTIDEDLEFKYYLQIIRPQLYLSSNCLFCAMSLRSGTEKPMELTDKLNKLGYHTTETVETAIEIAELRND